MKAEVEPDDFLNGLSLGIWDEEFGYYKPKSPEGLDGLSERKCAGDSSHFSGISIISNVVEVEFGEPDITTTEDMKSGEW